MPAPRSSCFPPTRRRGRARGSTRAQFRSARVEPTGAFKISPLPAGDYYVAAVPDEVSRDWQEPAFLEALSRVASRVKIAEGEKKTQDLRVREFR